MGQQTSASIHSAESPANRDASPSRSVSPHPRVTLGAEEAVVNSRAAAAAVAVKRARAAEEGSSQAPAGTARRQRVRSSGPPGVWSQKLLGSAGKQGEAMGTSAAPTTRAQGRQRILLLLLLLPLLLASFPTSLPSLAFLSCIPHSTLFKVGSVGVCSMLARCSPHSARVCPNLTNVGHSLAIVCSVPQHPSHKGDLDASLPHGRQRPLPLAPCRRVRITTCSSRSPRYAARESDLVNGTPSRIHQLKRLYEVSRDPCFNSNCGRRGCADHSYILGPVHWSAIAEQRPYPHVASRMFPSAPSYAPAPSSQLAMTVFPGMPAEPSCNTMRRSMQTGYSRIFDARCRQGTLECMINDGGDT